MAVSPWFTLRQARDALRGGRPDEARRLLDPLVADGYRKAAKLTPEVAGGFLTRAERHLRADNVDAAWADLLAAEAIDPGAARAVRLRQTLTRLGLAECRAALEAGNPVHVIETVARMTDRRATTPELAQVHHAALGWVQASEQADRGDFLLAQKTAAIARGRVAPPESDGLDRFISDLGQRHERFQRATAQLGEAADGRRWREALKWAEEVVAVAPDHREARAVRAKAWDAVQPPPTAPYHGPADSTVEQEVPLALAAAAGGSAFAATKTPPPSTPRSRAGPSKHVPADGPQPLPKRFLLWVDGVGGYLVCLGPRVTFGQAVGDAPVDVPLFAELSRMHAELYRDGEGYVLESARGILVNGGPSPRSVLRPGDRVTLGPTCQFVFHLPVPVSPSARLELVSGHRLPLAVDGVLLMAETLVLGPGAQSHVQLPVGDVLGSVVLYRGRDGLGVRCPGAFRVDNKPCQDRAELPLPCVVTADRFTFALEPVGPRL
jgi:hypothetical protein